MYTNVCCKKWSVKISSVSRGTSCKNLFVKIVSRGAFFLCRELRVKIYCRKVCVKIFYVSRGTFCRNPLVKIVSRGAILFCRKVLVKFFLFVGKFLQRDIVGNYLLKFFI